MINRINFGFFALPLVFSIQRMAAVRFAFATLPSCMAVVGIFACASGEGRGIGWDGYGDWDDRMEMELEDGDGIGGWRWNGDGDGD